MRFQREQHDTFDILTQFLLHTPIYLMRNEKVKWLTSSEVGVVLGMSANTIRYMAFDMLPFTCTPGGQRRYHPADVERYKKIGYIMHRNRNAARQAERKEQDRLNEELDLDMQ